MKKLLVGLCAIFICTFAVAHTINWHVGDQVYQTTTCNSGDNIILPASPTKYGYTFQGWRSEYTPIEYIETDGTQYIDTKFNGGLDTELEADVVFTDVLSAGGLWGAFYPERSISANFFRNPATCYFGEKNISVALYNYVTQGTKTNVKQNKTGIYFNTTRVAVFDTETGFSVPSSLYLFAVRASNTNKISVKLYSMKIRDNGVLVRDFIPVLDKDGTPCLYDRIESKYYYNATSGQFIAGPEI